MPTQSKSSIATLLKRAILRATPDQHLKMILADLVEQRDLLEPQDLHERIQADLAIRKAESDLKSLRSRKKRD